MSNSAKDSLKLASPERKHTQKRKQLSTIFMPQNAILPVADVLGKMLQELSPSRKEWRVTVNREMVYICNGNNKQEAEEAIENCDWNDMYIIDETVISVEEN